MNRPMRLISLMIVFLVSLAMTNCASNDSADNDEQITLTVFAAKSLTNSFTKINEELIAEQYPELAITFSFDGSNTLVEQIANGAPADVLATADQKNMDNADSQNLVEDIKPFASNVLTLIVPAGNPGGITGLDDSLEGKKLVICEVGVPCGNATQALAENLGITLQPVSQETNVGNVRAKIEKDEADAGLVYITDALAAGDKVEIIEIDGAEKVVNAYPIALVSQSPQKEAAAKFIAAVLSEEGQSILAEFGFKGPELVDQS